MADSNYTQAPAPAGSRYTSHCKRCDEDNYWEAHGVCVCDCHQAPRPSEEKGKLALLGVNAHKSRSYVLDPNEKKG